MSPGRLFADELIHNNADENTPNMPWLRLEMMVFVILNIILVSYVNAGAEII